MDPLRPIDEHAYRQDERALSWKRLWPTALGAVVSLALLPLHLTWLGTLALALGIGAIALGGWELVRRAARC